MADLQSTLDAVMSLDAISRKMLFDILQKRQIEERREEIARDAQKALREYRSGKLTPLTLEEAFDKLDLL